MANYSISLTFACSKKIVSYLPCSLLFFQTRINSADKIKLIGAQQARRQDSVTEGAEINFGGVREVYLCEFERGTGAREIYPNLDQMN